MLNEIEYEQSGFVFLVSWASHFFHSHSYYCFRFTGLLVVYEWKAYFVWHILKYLTCVIEAWAIHMSDSFCFMDSFRTVAVHDGIGLRL